MASLRDVFVLVKMITASAQSLSLLATVIDGNTSGATVSVSADFKFNRVGAVTAAADGGSLRFAMKYHEFCISNHEFCNETRECLIENDDFSGSRLTACAQ